jgi:hypothetical protein
MIAVGVIIASLTACGGGGGSTSTTAPVSAADKTVADASVLKLSDFPAGWRADPHKDSEGSKCFEGQTITTSVGAAKAASDDFSAGQAHVTNGVAVGSSVEAVAAVMAKLEQKDTIDCLRNDLARLIEKNADGKKVTVEFGQLSADPIGDKVVAYQLKATVEALGLTPSVYADLYFVQVGRSLDYVTFEDVLGTFDQELRTNLLDTSVKRLRAELAET